MGLVLLGAIALGYVSLAVSLSENFRTVRPELVERWAPWDAGAKVELSLRLMRSAQSPAKLVSARVGFEESLRRDPTNVAAVRNLGLLAEASRDRPRAERLFLFAKRLSRRDLATHLWFIEREVEQEDIEGALHQFDLALRSSRGAAQILFPILLNASQEPAVARSLAERLALRPMWWRPFAYELAYKGKSLEAVSLITADLFEAAFGDDQVVLRVLLNRYIENGRIDLAWKLYQQLAKEGSVSANLLQNGGFEQENRWPPFDWDLVNGQGLAAHPETREGAPGMALNVVSENGRGGSVAKQLLRLGPGKYSLEGMADNSAARLALVVACAAKGSPSLLEAEAPRRGFKGKFRVNFSVPDGCDFQWLTLNVESRLEDDVPPSIWIDDLMIAKLHAIR